jgi:hypothetical protein
MASFLKHGYTIVYTPFNTPLEQSRVALYHNEQWLETASIDEWEPYGNHKLACINVGKIDYIFHMIIDDGELLLSLVKYNYYEQEIFLKTVKFIEVPA